jgi:hypothetical protein
VLFDQPQRLCSARAFDDVKACSFQVTRFNVALRFEIVYVQNDDFVVGAHV